MLLSAFKRKESKKFTLLLIVFLAFSAKSYAQGSLVFDGINDFVKYQPLASNGVFSEENPWTVEVVFKINSMKDQVLLAQNHDLPTGNPFVLGIDLNGRPYTSIGGITYTAEEIDFYPEECYHLSVVYGNTLIYFYKNGSLLSIHERQTGLPDVTAKAPFFIGQLVPNQSISFSGLIDELRIFYDERDLDEINTFLFTPLGLAGDNRLVCFDFSTISADRTFGTYINHSVGLLGDGNDVFRPNWTEENCMVGNTESVNPSYCAANTPVCSAAGLPSNEMLCNGDFEQFCQGLYVNHYSGSSLPPLFSPSLVFVSGSDVSNWSPTYGQSPDFYVRDGVGSLSGFSPSFSPLNQNLIFNPPTDTWNGLGNGVAAVFGEGLSYIKEGVETTLNFALLPGKTYSFSGWFYKTDIDFFPGSSSSNGNGGVDITFSNASNTYTPGSISLTSWQNVSANNGWIFATLNFTTPSTIPSGGLNTLTIENSALGVQDYIFMDDLSLRQVDYPYFPQYINAAAAGTENDDYNKRIKVDNQDNVYVLQGVLSNNAIIQHGIPAALTTSSGNSKHGSVITKYSKDGELLWSSFYPHMYLKDFELDPNGDIIAVGRTEPQETTSFSYVFLPPTIQFPNRHVSNIADYQLQSFNSTLTPWPNINYVGANTCVPQPLNFQWTWNDNSNNTSGVHSSTLSYNVCRDHTKDVLIAEIDATDGSLIGGSAHAYGGLANEEAVDIEIINNKAYIAVRTFASEFQSVSCNNTPTGCTNTYSSFTNSWQWNNDPIFIGQEVLHLDLNDRHNPASGKGVISFVPPAPQSPVANYRNKFGIIMMDTDGSDLFVLMEGALMKYNSNSTNFSSTYLPSAQSNSLTQHPRYLHVTSGSELYISFRETVLDQHRIEQRSLANLALLNAHTGPERPLSISSNQNSIFVTYWRLSNFIGVSSGEVFAVSKLDAGNLTNTNPFDIANLVWEKEANQTQLNFPDYHSPGNINTDIIYANNENRLFFVNQFTSTFGSSWSLSFDQKTIAGQGASGNHVFIHTLEDLGGSANFKSANLLSSELEKLVPSLEIYPNPTQGIFTVRSTNEMKKAELLDINGRILKQYEGLVGNEAVLDIKDLPRGTYILRLRSKNETFYERVLKH